MTEKQREIARRAYWMGYHAAKHVSLMRYENGKYSSRYRSHYAICADMLACIEGGKFEASYIPDVLESMPYANDHDNDMYWRGAAHYLRYQVC